MKLQPMKSSADMNGSIKDNWRPFITNFYARAMWIANGGKCCVEMALDLSEITESNGIIFSLKFVEVGFIDRFIATTVLDFL
jgi:hypothetical protein